MEKWLQLNIWKVLAVLIRSEKSVPDPARPESEPLQHLMRQRLTDSEFLAETWRNDVSAAATCVELEKVSSVLIKGPFTEPSFGS